MPVAIDLILIFQSSANILFFYRILKEILVQNCYCSVKSVLLQFVTNSRKELNHLLLFCSVL